MSDDELSEIVGAMHGRYSREVIDGAKSELENRAHDVARAESDRHDDARVESDSQVLMVESPPSFLPTQLSDGKLFSTGQITLATFLGAPLAGFLLLARNYQVLGKGATAWQPLLVGVVTTALLVILGLLLPENVPGTGLSMGSCIGMYYYVKQWQGGAIDAHLKAGARQGSWAAVVVLGLGCSVVLIGLLIAFALTFDVGAPPEGEVRDMPVARVRVSQAGRIEMNGVNLTPEQLRSALAKLKAQGGGVMYYRERWNEPPSAEAARAFEVITQAGLPIQMSSKPDFSDYIGPDGVPVPIR
ncbi:MAG TPA: hypothetical protein VF297_29670 [Pyrinomonadaceae bacterium]